MVGTAANTYSVNAAIEEIAAEAIFDGRGLPISVRVGGEGETSISVDLGNEAGSGVLIEEGSWEIGQPLIAFERPQAARELPPPTRGDGIDMLRELLNLESESDFRLIVGWLVAALRPVGPYPVLVLQGEPGSAKSTATEIIKKLIDPSVPNLRALPRSERDLAVAADKNWVLAFDNVSFLNEWLSNALCRLSTGGGLATRTLYSDDEETVFDQMRPVIVNGLDAIATRQDLLSRAIVVRLPVIERRVTEDQLWAKFDEFAPSIFGALLEAVATGLARLPHVQEPDLPRMADFATWVSAAEVGFGWAEGSVLGAFRENQESALITSLEGSLLATAIQKLVADSGEFGGEPNDLHRTLELQIAEAQRKGRGWPKNAQAMSSKLTLLSPALRHLGIEIRQSSSGRGRDKRRLVEIWRSESGAEGDGGDA
jgi:hypothetical protein